MNDRVLEFLVNYSSRQSRVFFGFVSHSLDLPRVDVIWNVWFLVLGAQGRCFRVF